MRRIYCGLRLLGKVLCFIQLFSCDDFPKYLGVLIVVASDASA